MMRRGFIFLGGGIVPPSPPSVVIATIIRLVCGHSYHYRRSIVIEASAPDCSGHSIGVLVVRRWAHIVEIVNNSFPVMPTAAVPITLSTALSVVLRMLSFLLAVLFAPAPVVALLMLLLVVSATAAAGGQSAVSACQVVRHTTLELYYVVSRL